MIPKVFHRVWLGGNAMPDEFVEFGETWERHHPAWEMKLWTDTQVAELDMPEVFSRARNTSEGSDILRYELMRRFGGVYVDTDFECRRPIDGLIEGLDAFAGYQVPGGVCTALIGSVPGHPAFEAAIELAPARVDSEPYPDSTGPTFLTELLLEFPDVKIFDPPLFYPYLWTETHRRDEDFPDAYAVHHWSESWRSREKLQSRIQKLHGRLAKAESARERAEERRADTAARLARAQTQIAAMESSPWWRLGRVVSRPLRSGAKPGDEPARRT